MPDAAVARANRDCGQVYVRSVKMRAMVSYCDALEVLYAARMDGMRCGKRENVEERYLVRFVWLTVATRPSCAFVPQSTGTRGMFFKRRRDAGSDVKVRLSMMGAEISVLMSMRSRMTEAGAARTHVKLLEYVPGHPNCVVRLFQAIVPSTFGTERYVYWPLCRIAARKGGVLFTG
jgi:hypothetical protein